MLIGDCVQRNAHQPHLKRNMAIIFKDREYNWEQVNQAANSLANALQKEHGVKKGKNVALLLYNSDAILLCYYGITHGFPDSRRS